MAITLERVTNDLIVFKLTLAENTYIRVPIEKPEGSDVFLTRTNRVGGFIYANFPGNVEFHVTQQPREITIYTIDPARDQVIMEFSMPLTEEQRLQIIEELDPLSEFDVESDDEGDFRIEPDDLPLGVELAPLHPIGVNPMFIEDVAYNGDVFDSLMAESKPLAEFLAEDPNNVVFVVNNTSATGFPRQALINAYEDRTAIRYKCKREGGLMQRVEDVEILNPYYKLEAPGTYLVLLNFMMSVLSSQHQLWKVTSYEPPKMVGPITSRSVLTIDGEHNVDGGPIDAVGANHCGPGEFEEVNLAPGRLVPVGGRRRRRTYRKKKGRKSTR
jgi:hypothetical protein